MCCVKSYCLKETPFLCCCRLSGYSPFAGEDQRETFSLVNNADYDFDDDVWDSVSDDAKDFIKRLLIKDKK